MLWLKYYRTLKRLFSELISLFFFVIMGVHSMKNYVMGLELCTKTLANFV